MTRPVELTPEDADALYDKLYGNYQPTTSPHHHAILLRGDEREVSRESRPDRQLMAVTKRLHRAVVLCRNVKGRPTTLAALVTNPDDTVGMILPAAGSHGTRPSPTMLGGDLSIDCRCGMTHEVAGDKLRSVVLGLPPRRAGKLPTIDITAIERVSA